MANMTYTEALDVLGLKAGFTDGEMKKSYRALTRQWHPDTNHAPEAPVIMARVNEAYELLSDPKNRVVVKAIKHHSIFDIVDT